MSFRKAAFLVPLALVLATAPAQGGSGGFDGTSPSSSSSSPTSISSGSSGGSPGGSGGGISVPEPADFALFGTGVLGLLIGRHGSRGRATRTRDEESI